MSQLSKCICHGEDTARRLPSSRPSRRLGASLLIQILRMSSLGRHLSLQSYDSYIHGQLAKTSIRVARGGNDPFTDQTLANAANLQIARTMERKTEMCVRSVLGASFSRLLQQLFVESVVISLLRCRARVRPCVWSSAAIIRIEYGNQYRTLSRNCCFTPTSLWASRSLHLSPA